MKTDIFILILCISFIKAYSQETTENYLEVFGWVMTDMGYNFNRVDPQWYDVMRPTKLPSYKDEFGTNGNVYFSVRQSHFGIRTLKQTEHGELKAIFDFDMFGVGVNAGQTTIWLHHAYAQLGHFGAGQTESAFMDIDVLPNTFEYWGPCGTLYFRNVQVRWIPILGPSSLTFALELPGASADRGAYANRVELANVKPRFPLPDFSGHHRSAFDWGYVQLGWLVRNIEWVDQNKNDTMDLSGLVIGYGVSASSKINIGKNDVLHLQCVYGAGVENYFNDAPVDVGIKNDFADKKTPVKGVALPDLGIVAFLDHAWNAKWTSSVGYSTTQITNSDGQASNAFKKGRYALANVIYSPIPSVLTGLEFQWIGRENKSDDFTSSATKINFSFKYNFSQALK